MMEILKALFYSEMLKKLFVALPLLVIGILSIRIVMALLKRGLKKTKLEKQHIV